VRKGKALLASWVRPSAAQPRALPLAPLASAMDLGLAPGRNRNSDKGEIEVEVVDDEVGLAVEVAWIEVEVEGVAAR
jgi:hypothetical protein